MTMIPIQMIKQTSVQIRSKEKLKIKTQMSREEVATDSQLHKLLQTQDPDIKAEIEAHRQSVRIQEIDINDIKSQLILTTELQDDVKPQVTSSFLNNLIYTSCKSIF